jgi:hypothetical protein
MTTEAFNYFSGEYKNTQQSEPGSHRTIIRPFPFTSSPSSGYPEKYDT